jgi:GNAT superfamily N-acetyltransferase
MKTRKAILLIILGLYTLGLSGAWAQHAVAFGSPVADLEVFVQEGCPRCAAAKAFLAVLQRQRPTLRMVVYRRALPLLALLDGKIVGDGTLHHRRAGARRHVGEVRVVAPAYRNRGVGRALLHQLIALAGDKGLKKLLFEVVADTEPAARRTAQVLGFVPVALLPGHVCDASGHPHDLLILERRLLDPGWSADGEVEDAAPDF